MRLGTCIALELALAAGAVSGLWFGVGHAAELAGSYIGAREAAASTSTPLNDRQLAQHLAALPRAELALAPPRGFTGTVFGLPDDELLAPLGASPLVRVKPNKGGTSLSLRADFESGARAAFKPQQIHPQSDPRREIAAFRIDRLLGIGHVPPSKPFKIGYQELLDAADPGLRGYTQHRILEEVVAHDGVVRGMVSWWIPEIKDAKIGGVLVDEPSGMAQWASYLQVGAEIPPEARTLVEQIATVVVFDVVIDNSDRWSGANAKTSPDGLTLYFMDNTLSFSKFKHGHETNLVPMRRIQVFPRGLIAKLRALTIADVRRALDIGEDETGLGPLLDDEEIEAILARRTFLLEYVDGLIAQFGEDRVLALP